MYTPVACTCASEDVLMNIGYQTSADPVDLGELSVNSVEQSQHIPILQRERTIYMYTHMHINGNTSAIQQWVP